MPGLMLRMIDSGFGNLAVRGSTLFFRFALSFYVVSYLGLNAAGVYGLAVGAIGIVPAALGWGLNYFVSREVVGMTPDRAAPLVRDRLSITSLSLLIGTLVAVPLMMQQPGGLTHTHVLILILLWCETFALDVYMPLIGLELAFQANILVLFRSALWIPIVVALGIWSPMFRTLDAVFVAWITAHVITLFLFLLFIRRWPVRAAMTEPMRHGWLGQRARNGWYIYFSDLGLVGLGYADRFIVNGILGLTATGIYTFYWSITNALQTLIATAVVQLALPRMIRVFRTGSASAWNAALRREVLKTLGYAIVLSVVIFLATEAIIRLSPPGKFPVFHSLLALLLLAAVVRSCSDLLNIAITSTGRDRAYAVTNVFGMFLTLAFGASFMWLFGLLGAGLSAVATASVLLLVRYLYLRRVMGEAATDLSGDPAVEAAGAIATESGFNA